MQGKGEVLVVEIKYGGGCRSLVCPKVDVVFFEVNLVWVSPVASFECGVEALLALSRAVRITAAIQVGWMYSSTSVPLGVIIIIIIVH